MDTTFFANWTTQLASVDPTTGAVQIFTPPGSTSLGYCIALAGSPTDPNALLAWDFGLEPATISRFDVSTGSPVRHPSVNRCPGGTLVSIMPSSAVPGPTVASSSNSSGSITCRLGASMPTG